MPGPATLHRWADLPLEKVTEMVARKMIAGDDQTIAQAYLKKGALVPIHAHAGEQLIYVLQGALAATIDGDPITVREGEVLRIARRRRAPGRSARRHVSPRYQTDVKNDTRSVVATMIVRSDTRCLTSGNDTRCLDHQRPRHHDEQHDVHDRREHREIDARPHPADDGRPCPR